MALFHYFKEMCLVNSRILYEHDGHKDTTKDSYRSGSATSLVRPYSTSQTTKRLNAHAMDRLAVAAFEHFPAQFEDKKHRPLCKVCSHMKIRAQAHFYSPVFNVSQRISNCFGIYHTALDIRLAREQLNH